MVLLGFKKGLPCATNLLNIIIEVTQRDYFRIEFHQLLFPCKNIGQI